MLKQPLRALVLSPSATHPRDYGNRNRVWQTTSFLKQIGYGITFMLYPIESDWEHGLPDSYAEMQAAWDRFIVIPPSVRLHQRARGEFHEVDEWWDPAIGEYLSWLFRRTTFDLLFVNYTYLSKAFDYAPKTTLKVLDTHDIFSGRKEMLAAHGVEPEFYYTTEDQERIAFDRTDVVLAIKDSERELIRRMTRRRVVSLPYFLASEPALREPAGEVEKALRRPPGGAELVIGFIGAENSVNVANVQRFLEVLERLLNIYTPPLRVVIAGNVCRRLWSKNPAVQLIGRVEEIDDFYCSVDVIVAPLDFSTGIKIKVGEALAYGKPIVSTANGFDGYPAFDPYHVLPDIPAVCRALIKIAYDPERRTQLAERTRHAARMASLANAGALAGLASLLRKRARRIVFITDEPFWERDTLWQERLYHWHELASYMAPITCLYVGDTVGVPLPRSPRFKAQLFVAGEDGAAAALRAYADSAVRTHCIVSVGSTRRPAIERLLDGMPLTLSTDGWADAHPARREAANPFGPELPDISVASGTESPVGIFATPLRYAPGAASSVAVSTTPAEFVVVLCSVEPGWRSEVEFILARLSQDPEVSVTVVGPDGDVQEPKFLDWVGKRGRIGTLLLVGSDRRMRRIYRSFATNLGIPCEEIAPDRFPFLHVGARGQPAIVRSLPHLVDRLLAFGCAVPAKEAHDTGWSRFWRLLEAA